MASSLPATPNPHGGMAAIDPHRKAQYSLRLSDIELPDGPAFNTVRLNHKPNLSDGTRTTQLRALGEEEFSLDIADNEDGTRSDYQYDGRRKRQKTSFVLLFDPSTQSCVLQPLTASYSFNLSSTPWESSAEKLKEQYPQAVDESDSSSPDETLDPLFSDASDGEPDENNPFDWRHQLRRSKEKQRSPSRSPAITAISAVPSIKSPPQEHVAIKHKSKANKAQRPASNRGPLPEIRMDRRASTRDVPELDDSPPNEAPKRRKEENKKLSVPKTSPDMSRTLPNVEETEEDEDDFIPAGGGGGLEIDFGDSAPPKRQRALTLTGSQHDGPISLRSAANSPRSQVNTPLRGRQDYDDFVMELGSTREEDEEDDADASEEDDSPIDYSRTRQRHEYDESDGDGDVEPIDIGSPAHGHAEVESNVVYDEDDYEKQMLEGFSQQVDTESDESEAE